MPQQSTIRNRAGNGTLARLCLRSEGVSVLLEVRDDRLPTIVHWGPDLGEQTPQDFAAVVLGLAPLPAPSQVEVPSLVAVMPEHWTGWMGRPGISGSRAGRAWSPRFTCTTVRLDGTPVGSAGDDPPLVNAGPASVAVDAEDPVAELALTLTLELTAGGLLRSRARLTNTGAEAYELNDLVLAYPVPQTAQEILDLAGRWGKERTPQRRAFVVGTHLREGRKGRTGPDAATVLHVGTPGFSFAEGEIWGLHTGWSGNHTHYAERSWTGEQVVGGGELLLPGEVRLASGEAYESPWIYGSYGLGLDQVARRFHRFLRARDEHPHADRAVTLNVWEAVYFNHDVDRLLQLAERAAAVGVERFVLDDGWFGGRRDDRAGLGDWTVSKDIWPDGLHPLVDRVRDLGMQFGLWFEPEMINVDSDVARAHPEWIMATGDRLPVESRYQQVINLGIPECYSYIRDAMLAILAEYDIAYIKWDHNRDLVDAGTSPDGEPGVHAQTLAFYRLVDELKAAHPGLEIESCSSGGARVDLGVLTRTDRIWVSDNIDPLDRQQMNRWTAQLVPPEMMGSHIASGRSHVTGRRHDLNFRAATAVFGHLGIEWNLIDATADELAELKAWVDFYRTERSLLLGGDLVRIDFPDPTLAAHGVVASDRSRAIYSFAFLGRSEVTSLGRIRLPGLDPKRRYRVQPVLVGAVQSGLKPPEWWQVQGNLARDPYNPAKQVRQFGPDTSADGIVATGAALSFTGLQLAATNPEHAVLLRVDAVDG
jgi:alpha-galactosidase